MTQTSSKTNVRMLAEAGVMIALATILSYIKIWHMPAGGSITIGSTVPLILFAIRWGLPKGLFMCLVFGVLQGILPGSYIISIPQMLLDYPIAYMMYGLSALRIPGMDRTNFFAYLPAILLASVCRWFSHVLSGLIFFPETNNPFFYSMTYNATFLTPDMITAIVICFLLWQPLKRTLFEAKRS